MRYIESNITGETVIDPDSVVCLNYGANPINLEFPNKPIIFVLYNPIDLVSMNQVKTRVLKSCLKLSTPNIIL